MFAVDDETGELTRDGRPVNGQLQRLFDLLWYDAEEFEQVLDEQWWEHDVPGSDETLWLPRSRREIFDEWVEEVAVAYRSSDSFGPMTIDGWQAICRVDDIYFILDGGDGFDVRVIGVDAFAEALAAADAFIVGDDGSPLSIWDSGSSPLPGPGDWFVVPVPSERIEELADTLGGQPVTVVDQGIAIEAVLTQDLRVSSATRLAGSFGYEVVWELTADEVRLISCDPYIVAANALRDMP